MRSAVSMLTCLAVVAGCGDDLPSVQVQGRFIAYAAAEELEVCPGTVTYAEEWTEAVAAQLGIGPDELLPMTYYFVGEDLIAEECPDNLPNCARREDDRIYIFSQKPLFRHELVHGIHLSAWPHRAQVLYEGLAETFDDPDSLPKYFQYSDADIDAAIEAEGGSKVYDVGAWLVYWTLTRYGASQFSDFWYATTRPSTAEAFRATFEATFGESLAAMFAEVAELPHCPIVTCGEPLPWDDGVWTTASPKGCDGDHVVGVIGDEPYDLRRYEVIEITDVSSYEISVSEHESPGQGALVLPCDDSCTAGWVVRQGETHPIALTPGKYRITTYQTSADDEGIVVKIRVTD